MLKLKLCKVKKVIMKNKIVIVAMTLLISNIGLFSQVVDIVSIKDRLIDLGDINGSDENFESFEGLKDLLSDVEIVMLGEQSHGEATAFETKIKLIKYLHQELGFDLLLFESGFYDAHKAWQQIEEGIDVREAMGNSISYLWSTSKTLIPLADYIEKNKNHKPLKLLGFDNQFYTNYSKKNLITDLSAYLETINENLLQSSSWKRFEENISYAIRYDTRKLKRNFPERDTSLMNQIILKLESLPSDSTSQFWIQTIINLKAYYSDVAFGTDNRDKQMADNLKWLKEKYKDSKIICWGATSHFLYNSTSVRMKSPFVQLLGGNYYKKQPMMGHYVKEMYDEKVYTIGFTAYQGYYGIDRKKKIKAAKKGTFEYLLSKTGVENFILPLGGWSFKDYKARPLANYYMKNDISEVMDAVIFNRNMEANETDWHFFLMIYPENKYIKLYD